MYSFLKKGLFTLDPEKAHDLTLSLLPCSTAFLPKITHNPALRVRCMGIDFPNPVGLAAGLDKDGVALAAWPRLGFGFTEIGTVTPKPQPGNPSPRLFRLVDDKAIINRMGFNNAGVEALVERVKNFKRPTPLGINIGKNKDTDLNDAPRDYQIAFEAVYAHADYVTVNLSSPNTPGLRLLQQGDHLQILMQTLMETRERLAQQHHKRVPIAVKLSPDMTAHDLEATVKVLMQWKVDSIIATNTTLERPSSLRSPDKEESGGLSGAPLFEVSTLTVRQIAEITGGTIPIIAVGGIMTPEQAMEKFAAGATLIQLYTGFIYEGPPLIQAILNRL